MPSSPAVKPTQTDDLQQQVNWKSRLDSIANMTKLITAPLFALGGATFIAACTTAAGVMPVWIGVSMLVTATATLATAIYTSSAAEEVGKNITRLNARNQAEFSAERTAHHLVEAMKANNLCLTDDDAKKKNWASSVQTEDPNKSTQKSLH